MINTIHSQVLPGFEAMNIDLRECKCECGCGETFYQKRVGRVRKYIDKTHKSKAAAARKIQDKANKPLIGDTVKELLDYLDSVFEVEHSLEWLTDYERGALAEMHASDKRETLRLGLNELFMRYCA